MTATAFEKIKSFLDANSVEYEFKEHEPVRTSEQAAAVRGEDIKIGAKALLLKADKDFILAVVSAAKRINSKVFKKALGIRSLRFASADEVKAKTGCVPGGVPPFAHVFGLKLVVDKSVLENKYMAFNAGEQTKSLKMKTQDYVRLLNPRIEEFSDNN